MALKKVQYFSVPVKLDNLSATGTTNSNHQARPNSVGAKVKNQSKGLLHDYLRICNGMLPFDGATRYSLALH